MQIIWFDLIWSDVEAGKGCDKKDPEKIAKADEEEVKNLVEETPTEESEVAKPGHAQGGPAEAEAAQTDVLVYLEGAENREEEAEDLEDEDDPPEEIKEMLMQNGEGMCMHCIMLPCVCALNYLDLKMKMLKEVKESMEKKEEKKEEETVKVSGIESGAKASLTVDDRALEAVGPCPPHNQY